MHTEQEQKIAADLISLSGKGGQYLSFEFIPWRSDGRDYKSKADKFERDVKLTLVEPIKDFELENWEACIKRAGEFLDMLEVQREYEKNNPDFFLSMAARTRDLKYNKCQ